MKLWERVVETRLTEETHIERGQFGFMPGRSTTEPIFILRQMMEKRRRDRSRMQVVFVDLEKAYDKVPRGVEWEMLQKRAVGSRDTRSKVRTDSGESDSFEVKVRVHQGSALSP